jgi:hypothetical protein
MSKINIDELRLNFDKFQKEVHLDFFNTEAPRYYIVWKVKKPKLTKDTCFQFNFSRNNISGRVYFFIKNYSEKNGTSIIPNSYKYYVYFTDDNDEIINILEEIDRKNLIEVLNKEIIQ